MTKYIFGILMCCFALQASAQYNGKGDKEISRYRPGAFWFFTGWRPSKAAKLNKYDRLITEVTFNDWVGDRDLFKNHWASFGLNTNFMFDIPLAKGNKVSLGIGIAHQFTTIRHNNHLEVDPIAKTTIFRPKDSLDVFSRSSLVGNSFSIPIEFRFRNEGWKHFKVHIGGKIGYQAQLSSKYVTKMNGHKQVVRDNGFYDANKLIYSAHVRIGMRNWAVFASYNFNTLFSNKNSTQLNAVQMGLSISWF